MHTQAADLEEAKDIIIADCDEALPPIDYRVCAETIISKQSFVLIPYKPNYFIGTYEANIEDDSTSNIEYQSFETKFQLSFKVPIVTSYDKPFRCFGIEGTQCLAFFGYTQLSVWQMANIDYSSPFRDTNFEPEIMFTGLMDLDLAAGWRLRLLNLGIWDHQSNGKVPPNSRSWNRTYLDSVFENGNHYVTLKRWQRWKEDQKTDPSDFKGDDNPDIEAFVGRGELKYHYAGDVSIFSVRLRDSKKHSRGYNFELGWSYPIKRLDWFDESALRLYVQYYDGYGETLIDYNVIRERIGFGLMLNDWL